MAIVKSGWDTVKGRSFTIVTNRKTKVTVRYEKIKGKKKPIRCHTGKKLHNPASLIQVHDPQNVVSHMEEDDFELNAHIREQIHGFGYVFVDESNTGHFVSQLTKTIQGFTTIGKKALKHFRGTQVKLGDRLVTDPFKTKHADRKSVV